jgi:hypothetical protein
MQDMNPFLVALEASFLGFVQRLYVVDLPNHSAHFIANMEGLGEAPVAFVV